MGWLVSAGATSCNAPQDGHGSLSGIGAARGEETGSVDRRSVAHYRRAESSAAKGLAEETGIGDRAATADVGPNPSMGRFVAAGGPSPRPSPRGEGGRFLSPSPLG